jgi:hypothetical protein
VQVPTVSNNPDFNSILRVGGKIFSVTQYESPRPGVAYLTEIQQNPTNGELTVCQAARACMRACCESKS